MEKFNFLSDIKNIVDQYEEIKKRTSDDYNLFTLLNRESDEVLTHSAIIADLLDSQGKHSLGTEPLKLFVQMVDIANFGLEGVQCFKEMPIGRINEDYTNGGRIDIYVKNKKNQIILIENKIYAAEQKNQLLRYYNFSPESTIIYLTLEGELSKAEDIEFDYKNISYKEDIINWIEQCIVISHNRPKLRESLTQYNHLLKKLTNQSTNQIMADKISEIIEQNFIVSTSIFKNYELAYNSLYQKLLEEVKCYFSDEFPNFNVKIQDYKTEKSLSIESKLNNYVLNIRIKDKSIIAINILNILELSKKII